MKKYTLTASDRKLLMTLYDLSPSHLNYAFRSDSDKYADLHRFAEFLSEHNLRKNKSIIIDNYRKGISILCKKKRGK